RHRTVPEQPCRANPALAPISLARALLQEMKSELQKMQEQQEMRNTMLEQMVTDTANQMNEQVSQFPLPFLQFGSGPDTSGSQQEEEEVSGDCTSCTFNVRVYLGNLLQRCDKLQEQMDSLDTQAPLAQCYIFPSLDQQQERLNYVETTIVQIQGDCEKLSFTSGSLQKDSQQKQKAIEV
ncbi:QRIC2 protein, partial [Zosterops hypoxanthus]|nr:QRIC2 protein [Zosterops hypoxanthus]